MTVTVVVRGAGLSVMAPIVAAARPPDNRRARAGRRGETVVTSRPEPRIRYRADDFRVRH
ncbi:hypothetical protein CCE02nite_23840 [Cellulosimicrobium cellulans]|uniref:Uncharacterized protein n=1 Tax=Cellulosimicrobium cellulans TaxID=1710 RepID=A0A4Y4E3D9_CELCE|nr:hypothetical protein CCE02nite_23840 [Cellulosimicrobium cellulans]